MTRGHSRTHCRSESTRRNEVSEVPGGLDGTFALTDIGLQTASLAKRAGPSFSAEWAAS